MAMTHRERITSALLKKPADRVPYAIRIEQWYNWHAVKGTLPDQYQGWHAHDIIRDIGGGIRGDLNYVDPNNPTKEATGRGQIFKEVVKNVDVRVHKGAREVITEYVTPLGTVSSKAVTTSQAEGAGAIDVERMFKSEKDYPIIEYILRNTEIAPTYETFQRLDDAVGEDGIAVGALGYSPMQYIMRVLMGYDRVFYELHDNPEKVERLLAAVKERDRKKVQVAVKSPALTIQVCGNWVDSIHTPVFRKYMTPWFQEIGEVMHGHGKLMQVHIDGEMKRLIPLFLESGIDTGEAFAPYPMTSVKAKDLREAWGDKVTIWGGLPSVIFQPIYTEEQFDDFVMTLFREMTPGYNVIVGMGDNVPFDGVFDRVRRVAELIEKHGRLPLVV